MGEMTHTIATRTATFALRGTRGALRSRRIMVRHAGRNLANSFNGPGGSRAASRMSTTHDVSRHPKAISTAFTRPLLLGGLLNVKLRAARVRAPTVRNSAFDF